MPSGDVFGSTDDPSRWSALEPTQRSRHVDGPSYLHGLSRQVEYGPFSGLGTGGYGFSSNPLAYGFHPQQQSHLCSEGSACTSFHAAHQLDGPTASMARVAHGGAAHEEDLDEDPCEYPAETKEKAVDEDET